MRLPQPSSLDTVPLRVFLLGLLALCVAGPLAARGELPAAPPEVLRHVPVDLSIFPPLSLNGEGRAENHLSLGLAAARSTVLRGLALAPLHWADEDLSGVQLTWIAGSAGGTVRGLQASQIANVTGALRGVQLTSIVNVVREGGRGVQLSSVANFTRRELAGAQIALVNVAGEVSGAQVGLVNVARRVSGVQLGLVNVAREADAAVGLLSLVGNGRREVEAFATELSLANVGVRLGGSRVHGLLVAGIQPEERPEVGATRWTWGGGVGAGFGLSPRLALDVDLLAQAVQYDGADPEAGLGTLRALLSFRAARHLAVFAGPTVNLFVSDRRQPDVDLGWDLEPETRDSRLWVGFAAGLRI
jgi:hypothetical protein